MRVFAAFFFVVGLLVFLGGVAGGASANKYCSGAEIEVLVCQEQLTSDMVATAGASITGMLMLIFGGFMNVLLEIRDKSEATQELIQAIDDGLRKRRSANEQRSQQ